MKRLLTVVMLLVSIAITIAAQTAREDIKANP